MKAGVYYGVEDFRVAEFPEPELKENGVKIAVKLKKCLLNCRA